MLKGYLVCISVRGTVDPRLFDCFLFFERAVTSNFLKCSGKWGNTFTIGQSSRAQFDRNMDAFKLLRFVRGLITLSYTLWGTMRPCVGINSQRKDRLGRCLGPNGSTFVNGLILQWKGNVAVRVTLLFCLLPQDSRTRKTSLDCVTSILNFTVCMAMRNTSPLFFSNLIIGTF